MGNSSNDKQTSDATKINTLKCISQTYDNILDKPVENWSQKEINIYLMLQKTLDKYKVRYSMAQFKLDVRDIKRNTKSCPWYQNSPYQKTLNWCLDQLEIKSYQHSSKTGNFKVIARFYTAQVKLTIIKKEYFHFLLENESTNIRTKKLSNLEAVTQIFGINPKITEEHRTKVIGDINLLIREIGMFYN